jgi:hypothetical protein
MLWRFMLENCRGEIVSCVQFCHWQMGFGDVDFNHFNDTSCRGKTKV